MDYFESSYGLGTVSRLLIHPKLPQTEKMGVYLQGSTGFEIDFISVGEDNLNDKDPALEPHCFHAYCAAMRGLHS